MKAKRNPRAVELPHNLPEHAHEVAAVDPDKEAAGPVHERPSRAWDRSPKDFLSSLHSDRNAAKRVRTQGPKR